METKIEKGNHGWKAETRVQLEGVRWLTLTTYKSDMHRGLLTTASVSEHAGGTVRHSFSFVGGGDFSKRVMLTPERGTEKNVRNQHALAVAQLPALVEQAKAHYAKNGKEAACATQQ